MKSSIKIVCISTIALSLDVLLKGQLKFLNKYFRIVAVSGADKHLEKVKNREEVEVFPIAMQREISLVKDLISLYKLYQYFKKEKPTIVHSITPKAGLLSMMAAYFAKVSIRMHTFTGLIFPAKKGFLQKLLIQMDYLLCKFATNIYPEGTGVKKDLIKNKITNKPLKIIAKGSVNGIDVSYFDACHFSVEQNSNLKEKLGIRQDDFVFIFVGRLVNDKGVNELVSAFSKLQKRHNHCKLLLVGQFENNLDPLVPVTLQKRTVNKSIIFVGFQEDVRPYFAISNALVFPSYREGFPNAVMQAGAMGLPSIVTDINGCNEIIIEGQNGTIISVKDSNAIYVAMEKLIEDKIFRTQLQQNARSMIASRYEQHYVWNEVLKEYYSLLS